MNKNKIPILATLLIFFSSLIIIFSPLRPEITSITPELKTNTTLTPVVPTSTPSPVVWQTYRNDEYGFEFQYPSDVEARPWTGDGQIIISDKRGNGGALNIYPNVKVDILKFELSHIQQCRRLPNESGEGCPEFLINEKGQLLPEIKQKHLSNIGQIYYRTNTPAVIEYDFYWWKIGQTVYQLSIPSEWSNSNQILSTFKFLPDTSTWKRFKSKVANFEIKYPENFNLLSCPSSSDCWGLESIDNGKTIEEDNRFHIMFDPLAVSSESNNPDILFSQFLNKYYSSVTTPKYNKKTIDKLAVYVIQNESSYNDPISFDYIVFNGQNIMRLLIRGKFDTSTQQLIDQIISTYKFTKP